MPWGGTQHDMSPIGMFHAADTVVKAVMVLLIAASVLTWAVLLLKVFSIAFAKRQMSRALSTLRQSTSLAEASRTVRRGTAARLLHEAGEEAKLSQGLPSDGIKERVAVALSRVELDAGRRMAVGTGILATVGSVAPFVGLFGTVWGIMRSFIGIANSNTTNLAVVAPGIAEALLVTGIGLAAAIPAVIFYNAIGRSIRGYRALTGDAVALILRHLSRDFDRHAFDAGDTSVRIAAE